MRRRGAARTCFGLAAALLLAAPSVPAEAARYEVIHSFADKIDGREPSLIVAGAQGTLFVVVRIGAGHGILKFTPPGPGAPAWSETQIAYVPSYDPVSQTNLNSFVSLIVDATGTLYGTTTQGGTFGGGTAFALSPPQAGKTSWTRTNLYGFKRQAGTFSIYPQLSYRDSSGVLFGRAIDGGPATVGTIFRLAPLSTSSGTWKLTDLTIFGPSGSPNDGLLPLGLTQAQGGAFYGVAFSGGAGGGGTLYRLAAPGSGRTSWTRQTLVDFPQTTNGHLSTGGNPAGDPRVDRATNVYGVAQYGGSGASGTVYRASPPSPGGTAWTTASLHDFTSTPDGATPTGALIEEVDGRLYGITTSGGSNAGPCGRQLAGCGIVFQLTPRDLGGHATPWNEVILHTFTGLPDGSSPSSLVSNTLPDGTRALFGTTDGGGLPQPRRPNYGYGTLFKVVP